MTRKVQPFFEDSIIESSLQRYGVFPTSVWEVDYSGKSSDQKLKNFVGDSGKARPGAKIRWGIGVGQPQKGLSDSTISLFPPRIAANILNLYAPEKCRVYDPFAGGGCRAIMAAKSGRFYSGMEIRVEEVESVRELADHHGVSELVNIIHGDARSTGLKSRSYDFCYTCPPYWNLEQYHGGKNDLSMTTTYGDFLEGIKESIKESARVLKPNSISCWVIGSHRDDDGRLLPINHDIARLHAEMGFYLKEEVVIYRKNSPGILRMGTFRKGKHLLIRMHEYCLVFVKQ